MATIVIIFLVVFNVVFILKSANYDQAQLAPQSQYHPSLNNAQAAFIFPVSEASYIPILDTNVPLPDIKAKAAIVYDVNSSRYLYAKNIEQKLPIASLTKILTAIAVIENLNFKDIISVPQAALKVDGEKQDLYFGERLIVEDLVKMMLINSSNDAAYALAEYAKNNNVDLIQKMNAKAADLGMYDSYFKDSAGLDDEAYSNAEDMIKLIKYVLSYPKLLQIMSTKNTTVRSLDGIEHHIQTTNRLLEETPNVLGGKTGYTEGALGCMVLIVEVSPKGDKIISIILGSDERFTDMAKLVQWSQQAYKW